MMLLLVLSASAEGVKCEAVPPGFNQYKLEVGYGVSRANTPRGRERARADARDDARRKLHDALCAAMPTDCERYSGYITEWQTPGEYDEATRTACATAVVDIKLLDPDHQRVEAEGRLSEMAASLATRLRQAGITAVRLSEIRRIDGCAIPQLEPARMWLRARLGAAGVTLIDEAGTSEAAEVGLEAVVFGGDVTLNAVVWRRDGTQMVGEPARFPARAYGADGTGGACVGSARLGVAADGRRRGPVRLDLDVPTRGGALCLGQPVEPVVSVDAPATVHVFSVDDSGNAYHVWPFAGSDVVESRVELERFWATPAPGNADETLVAIAVAAGADGGRLLTYQGFCRVPGTFSPEVYPSGSSVAARTWRVETAGCGPPPAEAPTAEAVAQALRAAETCR